MKEKGTRWLTVVQKQGRASYSTTAKEKKTKPPPPWCDEVSSGFIEEKKNRKPEPEKQFAAVDDLGCFSIT